MIEIREPDMLDMMQKCLGEIGYHPDLIRRQYSFSNFLSKSGPMSSRIGQIDIAAFSQSPPSLRSACLGIAVLSDTSTNSIKPYIALGAPQIFALHPQEGCIRRWRIGAASDPECLEEFAYSDAVLTFQQHSAEWGPKRIHDAKNLTFVDGPLQLDFFEAGLIPALEAALRPKLQRSLNNIVTQCIDSYSQWHIDHGADSVIEPLFRLLFRLIAAKMLIDRGDKPEWTGLDAYSIVNYVDDFYFRNEKTSHVLQDLRIQELAWREIRKGLNLQNLSVETLAYLYENAFVTDEVRRQQAIHATRLEFAEYIVRQLPIQELKEEERIIFEPFTGAAPFLIAGLGRLRELLLADMPSSKRHDYFVRMLSGIENEAFAREIGRYSLILADYPNRDSWQIDQEDAFTSPKFEQHLRRSKVVLCNPPYGKFTPGERKVYGDEIANYREVEALRRVLEYPPALLGFVLPRPFLERRDFRELRQDIAAKYRNITVTVLPDSAFDKASQEVVLLTAHNIGISDTPYSFASVTAKHYKNFLRTGKLSWKESHSSLLHKGDDVMLWRSPLQSVWDSLAHCSVFGSLIAKSQNGVCFKKGLLSTCISDNPQPDYAPGVQTVARGTHGYVENYLIGDYQYLCIKPEVMRDKAYLLPWERPKILINRGRTSRGYWNIIGVVDEVGIMASQQFYAIWPKEGKPVELLAALVSGPVANAFLFDYPSLRDNQIGWILQVPVPEFTEDQTELIVSLVQDYMAFRGRWIEKPSRQEFFEAKCLDLLYLIDAAVLEAYALPAELEQQLLRQFDGVERRPLPFNFPGYGEGYERAKQKLQEEKALRAIHKRYHALVDQEFLTGLTLEESEEMERLSQDIDASNAPFYDKIIAAMQPVDE